MSQGPLRVVEAFTNRHPAYAHCGGAVNQCAIATRELVDELMREGYPATVIWVRGHAAFPSRAHPSALQADAHALVRLGDGTLIDVTRCQFDPTAALPTVYASDSQLRMHWLEMNDDPDRNQPWRSLH